MTVALAAAAILAAALPAADEPAPCSTIVARPSARAELIGVIGMDGAWRAPFKVTRLIDGPNVGKRITIGMIAHTEPRLRRVVTLQVRKHPDGQYTICNPSTPPPP